MAQKSHHSLPTKSCYGQSIDACLGPTSNHNIDISKLNHPSSISNRMRPSSTSCHCSMVWSLYSRSGLGYIYNNLFYITKMNLQTTEWMHRDLEPKTVWNSKFIQEQSKYKYLHPKYHIVSSLSLIYSQCLSSLILKTWQKIIGFVITLSLHFKK